MVCTNGSAMLGCATHIHVLLTGREKEKWLETCWLLLLRRKFVGEKVKAASSRFPGSHGGVAGPPLTLGVWELVKE